MNFFLESIDTLDFIFKRPFILGNRLWSIQWKKSQKQKSFYQPKDWWKDSNVEDSCPMIVDDETQIEPQELTFAQKLQVKLDEARLKKPSIHSNTIDIE